MTALITMTACNTKPNKPYTMSRCLKKEKLLFHCTNTYNWMNTNEQIFALRKPHRSSGYQNYSNFILFYSMYVVMSHTDVEKSNLRLFQLSKAAYTCLYLKCYANISIWSAQHKTITPQCSPMQMHYPCSIMWSMVFPGTYNGTT